MKCPIEEENERLKEKIESLQKKIQNLIDSLRSDLSQNNKEKS